MGVLMAMLNDVRILVFFMALTANQVNIFVDANIRAVRRVMMINIFAVVCMTLVGSFTMLELMTNARNFTVFEYDTHHLEARLFVGNGFPTIIALLLRNVYRKRDALLKRSTRGVIDCVSYRCHLMLQQQKPEAKHLAAPVVATHTVSARHIQRMRYVHCIPPIHAAHVILPRVFDSLVVRTSNSKRVAVRMLGWTATVASVAMAAPWLARLRSPPMVSSPARPEKAPGSVDVIVVVVAIVLTFIYTVMACLALCQRHLLYTLCSSFDFIFLTSQLTFVHVATADFFRWQRFCLSLLVTWLWSHWVLCIDALTPIARESIGFQHVHLKVTSTALVVSTAILTHLLIFSDASIDIYDRILWSGRILGKEIDFHLLSTFYSSYSTVVAWALRLLWRVFSAKRDELIVIDGQVAYDNYFRNPKKPKEDDKDGKPAGNPQRSPRS